MERMPDYRPCDGIDCPHAGKGGPCWGQVTLIDSVDTESQHIDYYACEGHVEVALYGFGESYRRVTK